MADVTRRDDLLYGLEVESDSRAGVFYEVTLDLTNYEFSCTCPGFRYSPYDHCKHIAENGPGLRTEAERQASEEALRYPEVALDTGVDTYDVYSYQKVEPVATVTVPSGDEPTFEVSLNDGDFITLGRAGVEWLVNSLRAGDQATVTRVS